MCNETQFKKKKAKKTLLHFQIAICSLPTGYSYLQYAWNPENGTYQYNFFSPFKSCFRCVPKHNHIAPQTTHDHSQAVVFVPLAQSYED